MSLESPVNTSNAIGTYQELCKEFRDLYPTVMHAFDLIPQMYNRLTLVDKVSHKEAIRKIYDDHKDLPGFSRRNIYRSLPSDNHIVPKRVVPARHNSSQTECQTDKRLSITKIPNSCLVPPKQNVEADEADEVRNETDCAGCKDLLHKNLELMEALQESSKFKTADVLHGQRVYSVPKEKWSVVVEVFKKSKDVCYIIFDNVGNFTHAESDIERIEAL